MHWFRRHPTGRPPHPDILTPAEWRVLEHVREGSPNAEIAVRLGVSINTVRTHVSSMLAKLELPDRRALAAWDGAPSEVSRRELERTRFALPFSEWPSIPRIVAVGGAAVVGVVVLWVAIGVTSDGGAGDDGGVLPVPTSTAPAAEETSPPVQLIDGLPAGAVGPLLVYMVEGSPPARFPRYPTFNVVVYDAGARSEVTSFGIGTQDQYPLTVAIADRELLVNYQQEIVAYLLDGSEDRVLYSMPEALRASSAFIPGFAVSADQTRVAFSLHGLPDINWSLSVVDVSSGNPVAGFLPSETGFLPLQFTVLEEFHDSMTPLVWAMDGESLIAHGATYVRDDGMVHTDGTGAVSVLRGEALHSDSPGVSGEPLQFTQLDVPDQARVLADPTGRYLAFGSITEESRPPGSCLFPAYDRLDIIATDDSTAAVTIASGGVAVTPLEWSPDGSTLLYAARPVLASDSECEFAERDPEFWLWESETHAQFSVSSHVETRRGWYGDRALLFECGGRLEPGTFLQSYNGVLLAGHPDCVDTDVTLLLDGHPVTTAPNPSFAPVRVMGFIEVP